MIQRLLWGTIRSLLHFVYLLYVNCRLFCCVYYLWYCMVYGKLQQFSYKHRTLEACHSFKPPHSIAIITSDYLMLCCFHITVTLHNYNSVGIVFFRANCVVVGIHRANFGLGTYNIMTMRYFT